MLLKDTQQVESTKPTSIDFSSIVTHVPGLVLRFPEISGAGFFVSPSDVPRPPVPWRKFLTMFVKSQDLLISALRTIVPCEHELCSATMLHPFDSFSPESAEWRLWQIPLRVRRPSSATRPHYLRYRHHGTHIGTWYHGEAAMPSPPLPMTLILAVI